MNFLRSTWLEKAVFLFFYFSIFLFFYFTFLLFTFYFLFPWISCWSSFSLSFYSFGNLVILITRHNSDVDSIVWSFDHFHYWIVSNCPIRQLQSSSNVAKHCQTLRNLMQWIIIGNQTKGERHVITFRRRLFVTVTLDTERRFLFPACRRYCHRSSRMTKQVRERHVARRRRRFGRPAALPQRNSLR